MIALNVQVRFQAPGKVDRIFRCDYVTFGIQILGSIDEKLDYSLEEDYEGVRQTIRLRVKLDLIEAQFMVNFLASTEKRLYIDGKAYDVVNSSTDIEYPLFKNTMIGVHPELRFRCKYLGVVDPEVYTASGPYEGTIE